MSAPQTLLVVDPGLKLWGSERALAATLKALTLAWSRVILVTPVGAELAAEVQDNRGLYGPVEILHAPIGNLHKRGRGARLRAMAALTGLALRVRPSRLYLNQAGLARLLLPVARLLAVPLVVHVRLLEDVPHSLSLRGSERAPLHLVFVSDAMASAAASKPLAHVTVSKAYDPYPLSTSDPLPEVAPLVCVGRLAHGKGMHLLLEALAMEALAGTRADIFGAGVEGDDYAYRLEQHAKKHDLAVRFMGFRSDVRDRLPNYRFLVSTSRYETLGRVVMEGWEAGLVPVVYGDSGGAAEMVRKCGAGLVYDSWNADALASTLKMALALSEEERSRMVAAGRSWMTCSLDLDGYRKALRGVLFCDLDMTGT